jgi:hypothetical protein
MNSNLLIKYIFLSGMTQTNDDDKAKQYFDALLKLIPLVQKTVKHHEWFDFLNGKPIPSGYYRWITPISKRHYIVVNGKLIFSRTSYKSKMPKICSAKFVDGNYIAAEITSAQLLTLLTEVNIYISMNSKK